MAFPSTNFSRLVLLDFSPHPHRRRFPINIDKHSEMTSIVLMHFSGADLPYSLHRLGEVEFVGEIAILT